MTNSLFGLFLTLFGLPFLASGLYVFSLGFHEWQLYRQSATWTPIPVAITKVKLDEHRTSKSRSYKTRCVYDYTVCGKSYVGTKVGFDSDLARGGVEESRRYQRLEAVRRSGQPWTALVDPQDPARAVLFPEPSRDTYVVVPIGLLFTLVGLGIAGFGLSLTWEALAERRRAKLYPGRPWRIAGFETFVLDARSWRGLAVGWAFNLAWSGFVSAFVIQLSNDRHAPLLARIVVGVFALFALGFLVAMVYHTLRTLKYGSARLVLSELPIRPGEPLVAELQIDRAVESPSIALTLKCMRSVRHGKSTRVETLREITASAALLPDRRSARVAIAVPPDLPARQPEGSHTVHWELHASAETPGVDFGTSFTDLPVYVLSDPALLEKSR